MKITGVKVHQVEWERGAYHWRDGIMPAGPTGRTGLLRILTDEGIEGLAPCPGRIEIEEIKYQLLGQDPLNQGAHLAGLLAQPAQLTARFCHRPGGLRALGFAGPSSAGSQSTSSLAACATAFPPMPAPVRWTRIDEYLALADHYLAARATGRSSCTPGAGWSRMPRSAARCASMSGDDIVLMYDASSMFNLFEEAVWFGRQSGRAALSTGTRSRWTTIT